MTRLAPALFPLLRALGDGRFHSGVALAAAAGRSRASVCTLLADAQACGIRLHAIRGRGYRLPEPIDWIDPARVAASLGPLATRYPLHRFDVLDSTNAWLLNATDAGAPDGSVCCSEYQSAGRGRRGRSWQAALAGGLTFSLLARIDRGLAGLAGLSLAAGLAVARALEPHCGHPLQLKWPNDLVVGPRKLGGLLIEVRGDIEGAAAAVIGIGLNVRLPAAQREHIDQAVIDLAELGVTRGRNDLLADCLRALDATLAVFRSHGFAALRADWMARDVYAGRQVCLHAAAGVQVCGEVAGVDDSGALLLRDRHGQLQTCHGGELSLRAAS